MGFIAYPPVRGESAIAQVWKLTLSFQALINNQVSGVVVVCFGCRLGSAEDCVTVPRAPKSGSAPQCACVCVCVQQKWSTGAFVFFLLTQTQLMQSTACDAGDLPAWNDKKLQRAALKRSLADKTEIHFQSHERLPAAPGAWKARGESFWGDYPALLINTTLYLSRKNIFKCHLWSLVSLFLSTSSSVSVYELVGIIPFLIKSNTGSSIYSQVKYQGIWI